MRTLETKDKSGYGTIFLDCVVSNLPFEAWQIHEESELGGPFENRFLELPKWNIKARASLIFDVA